MGGNADSQNGGHEPATRKSDLRTACLLGQAFEEIGNDVQACESDTKVGNGEDGSTMTGTCAVPATRRLKREATTTGCRLEPDASLATV